MEHQPFEDWLLNDKHLTPAQKLDINRHIAACQPCASLARANLALNNAPFARPADGFVLRFQRRLEAERAIQRRRAGIGAALLALAGIGLIAWLLAPLLSFLSLSPVQIFTHWVNAVVYLAAATHAAGIVSEALFGIALEALPPSVWLLLFTTAIGLIALMAAPLRRQDNKKHAAE